MKTFGVELELYTVNQSRERTLTKEIIAEKLMRSLEDEDVDFENNEIGLRSENPNEWTSKYDGSHSCVEITTPILSLDEKNIINYSNLVNVFFEKYLNPSKLKLFSKKQMTKDGYGMHVHIGRLTLNDRQQDNIAKLFISFENVIMSTQIPNRKNNYHLVFYKKYLPDDLSIQNKPNNFFNKSSFNHKILNRHGYVINFGHTNTIELRHHNSTYSSEDVKNWLMLITMMMDIGCNYEKKYVCDVDSKYQDLEKLINESEFEHEWLMPYKKDVLSWVKERRRAIHNY